MAAGDEDVHEGVTGKTKPGGVLTASQMATLWREDAAWANAEARQTETQKASIRSRGRPASIDAVEYGQFGRATVTATLFGGMDESLYAEFAKGASAMMNPVESTLKHTHGAYGPAHMASRGTFLDVIKTPGEPPLGSSGIQIRFETDLIIEGIRPGRTVRVRPVNWPQVQVPREEYINDSLEERFPTPAMFPKY